MILHIDIDYFFAQVEELNNPKIKNKPFAISGKGKRSVISTCNYIARDFGVRAGMPFFMAQEKCPEILAINGNMDQYIEVSKKFFSIISTFSETIEPVSIDEAYLDLTNTSLKNLDHNKIFEIITSTIKKELKLTVSCGLSENKLLAKISSNINKPAGNFFLPKEKVENFMQFLKIEKIPGIGEVTNLKLKEKGIENCGDLQRFSLINLHEMLGKYGYNLYYFCRGIDNRKVISEREPKSVSVEFTFEENLSSLESCKELIVNLFQKLMERIDRNKVISGIFIKVTTADFKKHAISRITSDLKIKNFLTLFEILYKSLEKKSLRLIGLGVKIQKNQEQQLYLKLF